MLFQPASYTRLEAQFFQQIEGDLQTVGLFGVDVNADVILARQQGQGFSGAGRVLPSHRSYLRAAVARVQGREFDRDTRTHKYRDRWTLY